MNFPNIILPNQVMSFPLFDFFFSPRCGDFMVLGYKLLFVFCFLFFYEWLYIYIFTREKHTGKQDNVIGGFE